MTQKRDDATILIVDDTETVRRQIQRVLAQETGLVGQFLEAASALEGYKQLVTQKVDLIVCDVVMPEIDGFKFLSMVKGHSELAHIPVLLLTSQGEQESKNRGLKQGASDYLTKPFNEIELLARVRVHLTLKLVQDELREANKQLTALSNTDGLTEIFNRRHLMNTMAYEISRAARYSTPMAFLLMDLDDFKSVNDTYGHQAGDQVLISFCARVKTILRRTDIFARYGGEEFAILLPQAEPSGVENLAEKIRVHLADNPFDIDGRPVTVTVSCGIAGYKRGVAETIDAIIMEADKALYLAKQTGKNSVVLSADCLEGASVPDNED